MIGKNADFAVAKLQENTNVFSRERKDGLRGLWGFYTHSAILWDIFMNILQHIPEKSNIILQEMQDNEHFCKHEHGGCIDIIGKKT